MQYARRGEFGPHTRHVERFDPPQLLCTRHGVPYPHPKEDGAEIPDELASPSPPSSPIDEHPEPEGEPIPPRPPKDLFQAVFGDEEEEDEAPAPVVTTMPTAPRTKRPQKKRQRRMGPLTFRMDDDDDDP